MFSQDWEGAKWVAFESPKVYTQVYRAKQLCLFSNAEKVNKEQETVKESKKLEL